MNQVQNLLQQLQKDLNAWIPTATPPAVEQKGVWDAAVRALDTKTLNEIASRHQINIDTLIEEHLLGRVGAHEGKLAFPVQEEGKIVALHVYTVDGQAYTVPVRTLEPLVYPNPAALGLVSTVHIVPNPVAYLRLRSNIQFPDDVAVVAARGGAQSDVAKLIHPGQTAYIWTREKSERWAKETVSKIEGSDVYLVDGDAPSYEVALSTAKLVRRAPAVDPERDEPFPMDLLPPLARGLVQEYCRVFGCPPEMPFLSILGTVSGLTFARVKCDFGRVGYTYSNVYCGIFASSGTGKTVMGERIAKPATKINGQRLANYRRQLPRIRAREALLKKQRDRLHAQATAPQRAAAPGAVQEPTFAPADLESRLEEIERELTDLERQKISPAFIVGEMTSEALEIKLSRSASEFAFAFSTDARKCAAITLGGLYQKKGSADDSLLLKAYEGDSHSSERVSREPVWLEAPRMTVLWSLQTDLVPRLFNPDTVHSGSMARFFFGRFEFLRTRAGGKSLDRAVLSRWDLFCELLAHQCQTLLNADEEFTMIATDEVRAVFNAFENTLHEERRTTTNFAGAEPFVDRWPEKAKRLAILLQLIQNSGNPTGVTANEGERADAATVISIEIARSAVGLMRHLAAAELRLLTGYRSGEAEKEHQQVIDSLQRHGRLSARDLRNRTGIADASLEAVLDRAVLRGEIEARKGLRTTHYSLAASSGSPSPKKKK